MMNLAHPLPVGDTVIETAPDKGLLFILIGPTAVGKNSIMNAVMERLPRLRQLPTVTTRSPRPNEQEGREHFFVNRAKFDQLLANGELLESQEVVPGFFYGTPRQQTQAALHANELLIADIDILGAKAIKAAIPDQVVLIFVEPPNMAVLAERIRKREDGKMTEEEITKRLERAKFELSHAGEFEHRVVNDILETAVRETLDIIAQAISKREQ